MQQVRVEALRRKREDEMRERSLFFLVGYRAAQEQRVIRRQRGAQLAQVVLSLEVGLVDEGDDQLRAEQRVE